MTYTPYHADWQDYPDTTTPITAAALEYIEAGIGSAVPKYGITTSTTFRMQARGSAYAIGVDEVDNVGWFGTTGLFTSTDNISLTSQALPPLVTSATQISRVLRFGSNVYAYGYNNSNVATVWKSIPPSAGTVSWTAVKTLNATGAIGTALEKSSWTSGTNYLYVAEYADPSGGPVLYRSSDGTTWTTARAIDSSIRHYHTVAPDPYNPGHVYLLGGDGRSKVVWRSTDSGDNWTLIVTDNAFQAVQVSFSSDWVWFAGDAQYVTVWVLDRDNPTVPIIASTNHHSHFAVPGGTGARGPFTDGVFTSGSATFTSATAAFVASDVGKEIRFDFSTSPAMTMADGVYITAYTNATTVTLSKLAGSNQTGLGFRVDGDQFYRSAFYGAVDPDTGIYYANVNDNTAGGTRSGLFYLPSVGGRLELLEVYPSQVTGQVFIRGGYVWFHQAIHPLPTLVSV